MIPTQDFIIMVTAFFAAFHFSVNSLGSVSRSVKGANYKKNRSLDDQQFVKLYIDSNVPKVSNRYKVKQFFCSIDQL